MLKSKELPDCMYSNPPVLIRPSKPTPNHSMYLSNLDDQNFLRFSIKYVFLFKKSVSLCKLKQSLSHVLDDYYPFAGRLRKSGCEFDHSKLEVDCNGEGAVFAEGFMDICAEQFLQLVDKPNRSWRKLLFRVDSLSFLDVPPLVVQVTNLRCGGMILCTGINHCLADGIGTSQFLHAWAHLTTNHHHNQPIKPFHSRHVFKPHNLNLPKPHPQFTKTTPQNSDIINFLKSQPLIPSSITFTSSHILRLKRRCIPSLKCTTFETLASHTWRSWVKSLNFPPTVTVKLLFSVNVRKILSPQLPQGYYGNGFILGCAQSSVVDLVNGNFRHGVKLVQEAKSVIDDGYVRSMADFLEDKMVKTDLSASLVISQWSKLGLEDLDFGEGKTMFMGPVSSDIYCLFLPVVGDLDAVRVLVSMPESVVGKFEYYMNEFSEKDECDRLNGEENLRMDHSVSLSCEV